jgi:hypothetical protein
MCCRLLLDYYYFVFYATQEGPGKLGSMGIEWDTSSSGLCQWCAFVVEKHEYQNKRKPEGKRPFGRSRWVVGG